jgi:hypothetical protein
LVSKIQNGGLIQDVSLKVLIFLTHTQTALRCYACTWTGSSGDPDCITDPISVEGQNIVTCAKKYCTILRQELLVSTNK